MIINSRQLYHIIISISISQYVVVYENLCTGIRMVIFVSVFICRCFNKAQHVFKYTLDHIAMSKKPTYIKLPIYSVTAFKNIIYFSGGGGGKTGIPNQIFIFQGRVTPEPINRIQTGKHIIENMTANEPDELLICSANESIVIFKILQKGKELNQIMIFEGDFSFKNATINSIYVNPAQKLFVTGGDDRQLRFYLFGVNEEGFRHQLAWSHEEHRNPIRNIDGAGNSHYLSTDNDQIVVVDYQQKSIIRKVYSDTLNPLGSAFQSAYFNTFASMKGTYQVPSLVICHYIPRSCAFISRELQSKKIQTLKVSDDQSCLTARNHRYVGIACGNGTTYMIDPNLLECVSKQKGHSFVITAATMTRGMRFITGTPECSYYIQQTQQSFLNYFLSLVMMCVLVLGLNFADSIGGEL